MGWIPDSEKRKRDWNTWNIKLWLGGDEHLYDLSRRFMKGYNGKRPYKDFALYLKTKGILKTGDGVNFNTWKANLPILDEYMNELRKDDKK